MEYIVYCRNNDMEFFVKYNSEFRNKSKENKADMETALKDYCIQNNLDMENIEIIDTKNTTKRKRSEKTKTSTEAKMRWEDKTYRKYTVGLKDKKYVVRLRNEDDGELIEYIELQKKEGMAITEIFRCALTLLKECKIDRQN